MGCGFSWTIIDPKDRSRCQCWTRAIWRQRRWRALAEIGPIKLRSREKRESSGRIQVRARTGDVYVPGRDHWTDWQDLGDPGQDSQTARAICASRGGNLLARSLHSPRLADCQRAGPACFPEGLDGAPSCPGGAQ